MTERRFSGVPAALAVAAWVRCVLAAVGPLGLLTALRRGGDGPIPPRAARLALVGAQAVVRGHPSGPCLGQGC